MKTKTHVLLALFGEAAQGFDPYQVFPCKVKTEPEKEIVRIGTYDPQFEFLKKVTEYQRLGPPPPKVEITKKVIKRKEYQPPPKTTDPPEFLRGLIEEGLK